MSRAFLRSSTTAGGAAPRQVICISGCTSGLGRELAREFARLGHIVVGCGRRESRLQELRAELGEQHFFTTCDASDPDSVKARPAGDWGSQFNSCAVTDENCAPSTPHRPCVDPTPPALYFTHSMTAAGKCGVERTDAVC